MEGPEQLEQVFSQRATSARDHYTSQIVHNYNKVIKLKSSLCHKEQSIRSIGRSTGIEGFKCFTVSAVPETYATSYPRQKTLQWIGPFISDDNVGHSAYMMRCSISLLRWLFLHYDKPSDRPSNVTWKQNFWFGSTAPEVVSKWVQNQLPTTQNDWFTQNGWQIDDRVNNRHNVQTKPFAK